MRKKKEYPLNGKNVFGLSTMGWMNTGASSFMTSMFMLYLTDYSGIGAWAAVLGTVLLLVGRIVDTVDDPLQGWIMDRTKPGKWGKYKPYIILSIRDYRDFPSGVVLSAVGGNQQPGAHDGLCAVFLSAVRRRHFSSTRRIR